MFELQEETDSEWGRDVLKHLDTLLVEHAHLERKAASSALKFMFRYSEREFMQQPLSELAREELQHFEAVLEVIRRRGLKFGPQRPSPYARRLLSIVESEEPCQLRDRLLCAAVIEARSCERLKLLAGALSDEDPELADFYQELVLSEARHYSIYVGFAERIFGPSAVAARLGEICAHESQIVTMAAEEPRMHSGVPRSR